MCDETATSGLARLVGVPQIQQECWRARGELVLER
jgi:hypothetical protein